MSHRQRRSIGFSNARDLVGITRVFVDVSVFARLSFLAGIGEVVERSFFDNAAF